MLERLLSTILICMLVLGMAGTAAAEEIVDTEAFGAWGNPVNLTPVEGTELNVTSRIPFTETGAGTLESPSVFEKYSEFTLVQEAEDETLTYTLAMGDSLYAGLVNWNLGAVILTHKVFELPVAAMNNDEAFPGWRNVEGFSECFAAGKYEAGEHVPVDVDSKSYFLNIGEDIWLNLGSETIFFRQQDYGMDQTQWKQNYPDLVCQLAAPLLEPKIVYLEPQEIIAKSGVNRMSSNVGSIYVSGYRNVVQNEPESVEYDQMSERFISEEWGLPVLTLEGDTGEMSKDTAVNMRYYFRGQEGTCAVKWQEDGSLVHEKKNYTVQFDKAFEAVEGWGAQYKYCLKANYIDYSHARNVVNAKLWGQIVATRDQIPSKLAGLPNYGAVDGFPVVITLNGEFLGLYTFNIPKSEWMLGMGNGEREAIVCANQWSDATGFHASAAVDGTDFEIEYVSDENDAQWVTDSLNRLIEACINSDGSDLDTTIAQYIDWESAIDYYIFTVMVEGVDMTRKNYLLSTYDGTKWFFTAYDMDSTLGLWWDGKTWVGADTYPSFESYAFEHRIMELISTYKKDELKARYWELRSGVLTETNMATTYANFIGQIPITVYLKDAERWPGIPNTSVNNISQIRDYFRMRVQYTDRWIEGL